MLFIPFSVSINSKISGTAQTEAIRIEVGTQKLLFSPPYAAWHNVVDKNNRYAAVGYPWSSCSWRLDAICAREGIVGGDHRLRCVIEGDVQRGSCLGDHILPLPPKKNYLKI